VGQGEYRQFLYKMAVSFCEQPWLCFPAGYKVIKCRDCSGEYRLEKKISREKGCGVDIATKCLQFIEVL
jgi:hypothetical protein